MYVCMYVTKHYYNEAVGEKNQEILLGVKWERTILRTKNEGNVTSLITSCVGTAF